MQENVRNMPRVHRHFFNFCSKFRETVSIKPTWITDRHSCEVKNEMALSANTDSMLAV